MAVVFGLVVYKNIITTVQTNLSRSSAKTMIIGALLPLSGKNAFYGNEIKNAIDLALKEINSVGGINGKKLRVVYEDDQSDPKTGVGAMTKLIYQNRVPVVLGSWVSGVVIASAPIAEKNKTIVMAEAISPAITGIGDYVFRIQPSATQYSSKLIKVVRERLGVNRIAVLYINNEFGVTLRDSVRSEILSDGGVVAAEESYNQGEIDFRVQLTKIKETGPEALFIGGYQEQSLIIRQAHELGLSILLLAGPPFENRSIIEELGELAEGVIYPYHFVEQTTRPKTLEYLKNYEQKFGVPSGGFAPLMYDAVYIVTQAIERCDTDTKCIKNTLYKTSYDGVSGRIRFDINGDPILPIVIKTVKNGEFVKL